MAPQESNLFSDHDPALYEAMIDWDKRLGNESPFYQQLFKEHGVRSVLDTACGTGRHAGLFHSWGLRVEGADISPRMLESCRTRFGAPDGLRWVQRAFDQPADPPNSFDAAICVGNSLALASDPGQVARVLGALLASVAPNGVIVIQVVNLWRFLDGPTKWSKCKRFTLQNRDLVRMKGIHRCGRLGFIDVIDLDLTHGGIESHFGAFTFLGLEADELIAAARAGGAVSWQVYGSFQREIYRPETSEDIILVCSRA